MKRIFIFALLLALMLCVGCAPEYDILSYQEKNVVASCKIDEKYVVNIIKEENTRAIEVVEPSSLCGISFRLQNGEWHATLDELAIPMSESELEGICALCSIFDLESSAITTAYDEQGYGVVSFNMGELQYTVSYNELSLPQKIKITGKLEYDIEILGIELS